MTSEGYKDVLIVIAGYQAEIHKMLDANSGLKSLSTGWESPALMTFNSAFKVRDNTQILSVPTDSSGKNGGQIYCCTGKFKMNPSSFGTDCDTFMY